MLIRAVERKKVSILAEEESVFDKNLNLIRIVGPDTDSLDHFDNVVVVVVAVAVMISAESAADVDIVAAGTAASDTPSPVGTIGLTRNAALTRRADLMTDAADSSVVLSLHYLVARMM
jgi:hypothetical protein